MANAPRGLRRITIAASAVPTKPRSLDCLAMVGSISWSDFPNMTMRSSNDFAAPAQMANWERANLLQRASRQSSCRESRGRFESSARAPRNASSIASNKLPWSALPTWHAATPWLHCGDMESFRNHLESDFLRQWLAWIKRGPSSAERGSKVMKIASTTKSKDKKKEARQDLHRSKDSMPASSRKPRQEK